MSANEERTEVFWFFIQAACHLPENITNMQSSIRLTLEILNTACEQTCRHVNCVLMCYAALPTTHSFSLQQNETSRLQTLLSFSPSCLRSSGFLLMFPSLPSELFLSLSLLISFFHSLSLPPHLPTDSSGEAADSLLQREEVFTGSVCPGANRIQMWPLAHWRQASIYGEEDNVRDRGFLRFNVFLTHGERAIRSQAGGVRLPCFFL